VFKEMTAEPGMFSFTKAENYKKSNNALTFLSNNSPSTKIRVTTKKGAHQFCRKK
jgi:hypothetical protein